MIGKWHKGIFGAVLGSVLTLAIPFGANADNGNVSIDADTFPDETFRNYVSQNYDTDGDGFLTEAEIDAVTEFTPGWLKVKDLTGIGVFNELKKISIKSNDMTVFDISGNAELEELTIVDYELGKLDVSQNTKLRILECSSSHLSELDVSNNTGLTKLVCDGNGLKKLDISMLTELTDLRCDSNHLEVLDISNNSTLINLNCDRNRLSCMDTGSNPNLRNLICSNNAITSLDISGNDKLYQLDCSNNCIDALNVGNSCSLNTINCENNYIASLDVTGQPYLIYLFCGKNHIQELDLSKNSSLTYAHCQNNVLESLDLSHSGKLKFLNCLGNRLKTLDISGITGMTGLNADYELYSGMDFTGYTTLKINGIVYSIDDNGKIITPIVDPDALFSGLSSEKYYTIGIFPNECNNGFYVLKKNVLYFISMEDYAVNIVFDFGDMSIINYYQHGDMLFLLSNVGEGTVYIYDMNSCSLKEKYCPGITKALALGVAPDGRMYYSDEDRHLFISNEKGEIETTVETYTFITHFDGFDATNGNFYAEVTSSLKSTGLEAEACLLYEEDGETKLEHHSIVYYWPSYSAAHPPVLFEGRYLATTLTGVTSFFDSNALDVFKMTANYYIDSQSTAKAIFWANREYPEDYAGDHELSFGMRTIYSPEHDSFLVYTGDKTIKEYDLNGDVICVYPRTKEHVFSMYRIGDQLHILERSEAGEFSFEKYQLMSDATTMEIVSESTSLKRNESMTLTVSDNSSKEEIIKWSSGDTKVVTVDSAGIVFGMGVGTAVITAEYSTGLSTTIEIRVEDDADYEDTPWPVTSDGTVSNNKGYNYSIWSYVYKAYLYEDKEGYLDRIEYADGKVIVEQFAKDGAYRQMLASIEPELPKFGGFYSAADANYIVYGHDNTGESDEVEVLRVVKYDKNWKRQASLSLYGLDTYRIFDFGTLRMTEYNGVLYIHAAHTMYKLSDGLNHQESISLAINEERMQQIGVMKGYVSHSNNQFVMCEGNYIYRIDHEEAYQVGGVEASKHDLDTAFNKEFVNAKGLRYVIENSVRNEDGSLSNMHINYTGFAIGGAAMSSDNILVTYNLDTSKKALNRNAYIGITDKDLRHADNKQLTFYSDSDPVNVGTPYIVKLNDHQFLVLWEESSTDRELSNYLAEGVVVKYVLVDGSGNVCSEIGSLSARLSDCEPIFCSDGRVHWYYTCDSSPVFCTVNPYRPVTQIKSGWITSDKGQIYYMAEDGMLLTEWQEIDGKRYYLNGYRGRQTGWLHLDDEAYYFDENGVLQTGFLRFGSIVYYMDPVTGAMAKGVVRADGSYYYFDPQNGRMWTGWLDYEKNRYYFADDGKMVKGTLRLPDNVYYFNSKGIQQTGVLKTSKGVFYLDPEKGGAMHTGWLDYEKNRFYFASSGKMVNGVNMIDGNIYYFKKGAMQTGFVKVAGNYYFMNQTTGALQTGWIDYNGNKYYAVKDGKVVTGWQKIGNDYYGFNKNGQMLTGWIPYKDNMYYARPDGTVAINCNETIDGKVYTFNKKGICTNYR
ncbi:MAG: Ig-like domain-containing protein [Eubacterium sp.]|nr:Ig-like domain-containing protein [Eubacterium sp.]